jgi:hypothetical protein
MCGVIFPGALFYQMLTRFSGGRYILSPGFTSNAS